MPNLYLRWCLCFPADSCPGKGKGDTQEEEKARWHSQAASGSGGEGIFVRKTHVSANFPAESWPQSSGRENLLPFMRHFCRRAVRRVRPRGLAVQGGGSSGNGEEQENPGLDGGAARELPTQLARADGGQSRHLPACGLGGRGLRGAVGLPPPTRRDPPGDLTHSSHRREGQACVPNPAATISAQEFWEMG